MKAVLDGWATAAAMQLIAWLGGRVDPSRRYWIAALAAETDDIDNGLGKLRWAISGLPLAWSVRRPPAPRVAGFWNTSVDPRQLFAAVYRHRTDVVSLTTTVSLVGIVTFLAIFVMPWFEGVMGQAGFPMPLAARVVLGVLGSPFFAWSLMLLPWLLLWRRVRTGTFGISLQRLLPVVNLVCVMALIGLTSGFVGFLLKSRPVLRSLAEDSGYSRPAPAIPPIMPATKTPR